MPIGRTSTLLGSDGAMPMPKPEPEAEDTVPPRKPTSLRKRIATQSSKSVRNSSANLPSVTDVDVTLTKRRRKQSFRVQSDGNRMEIRSNGKDAQPAPHHQVVQVEGKSGTSAPCVDQNTKQNIKLVQFPFNKRHEELTNIERDTIELFPVPFLWNKTKSEPGPRFTNLLELLQFLQSDTECGFHIGEAYASCKGIIAQNLIAHKFRQQLEDFLQKTGVDQRVPILNPRRAKLDPPQTWPLITDYHEYVLRQHQEVLELTQREKCYRQSSRKRLFCAEKTSVLGLGANRIRTMFMTMKKGVETGIKRGKNRGHSESNPEGVSTEVSGKQSPPSRYKGGSLRFNSKGNMQTQEPSREVSKRPKRKRRPNVLYSDAVFQTTLFGVGDEEDTRNETAPSSVAEPVESDPAYVPPTEKTLVSGDYFTDDFLGTDSSENEVEIPVHLVTISNCIDYVPDGDVYSSSGCSFQARDEGCENHVDVPCIVDKLDESDDEDSHDPLFAEVEDEILRRIDEEASRKLLTKHVLEENTFDQDGQVIGGNLQGVQERSRGCPPETGNMKIISNERERPVDYKDRRGSSEREENYSSLGKKDVDTLEYATGSHSGTSFAKGTLSASSKQRPDAKENCKEAKKKLVSSPGIFPPFSNEIPEQNSYREGRDASTGKHTAEVQENDLHGTSSKRGATPHSEPGGPSKRARVRPDDNRLVRDLQESDRGMVGSTNDLNHEHTSSSSTLRKSLRVKKLQKSPDSQPEVIYASAPTPSTNEKGIATCETVYLYLWDHEACSRIEEMIPLRAAVSKCLESNRFSVYDGQDYDFGDLWSSNLTAMTEKDKFSWESREKLPGKTRKVRVWNLETGGLRTHFRSPAIQRLTGWLASNPENVVFSPSMILPCGRKTSCGKVDDNLRGVRESKSSTLRTCFRKQMENHVIQRIRDLRVRDIPNESLSSVQLWNTARKRTEPCRVFISHSKLLRFLFANPWLEPLCGQDRLFELESSTLHKLIRVRLSCASSIATYWDCVDEKVYNHNNKSGCSTIGEFLASSTRYVLYQGQDTPYFQSLGNYNALSRSPGYPVLVKCGTEIQRLFFSKGWVTVVVDPSSCSTACAVFWNNKSKTIHMQPQICKRISINSYIKKNPYMELYAGQNQPESVQQEIRQWIELVQTCSPQESNPAVLLTRSEFAPLKYRAVAWPNFSNECGIKSIHNRKISGNVSSTLRNEHQGHKFDGTEKDINTHVEQDLIKARAERRKSEDSEEELENRDLKPKDDKTGKEQEWTNCESISQAAEDVIVLEPSVCTSIGSDDMLSEDGMMSPELEEVSQNFEERLRAPARAAARLLTVIKEIGPRVLKQELVHDLRHALYENTTMEVGSVSQLLGLVQESNDLHFVRMAAELCSTLESLDISGCFTGNADVGYGSGDILTVREDLESGKICTMSDVVRRFRVVCQNLVELNEGFYLEGQAIDLKDQAEIVIQWYMKEKRDIFEREVKIRRLAKICDRARQIGFRKQRNRDALNTPLSPGGKGHDLTIRASSGQARVTFLNYRDEKGNSVMGKRTSVRVFGLPIDRQACQRKAGGARSCHVCKQEVFEADESSLVCGNRFFGSCNECVCKPCLESVTCMESSEFISFRDGQEWICVHCRGLCPAGSECLQNEFESYRQRNQLQSVRFTWPHEFAEPPISVLVSLIRRKQNGDFDGDPEQGDSVSLSRTSGGLWSTVTQCRIGAYRAFVKADGIWVAGTTFYVFSPHAKSTANERKKGKLFVRSTYYACPGRPKISVVRSGPKVHWNVAEDSTSGPVHAIPKKDSRSENQVVEDCSRVNGYDWQRAKRHNVVHWRPLIQEADPPEVEKGKARSFGGQYRSHYSSKTRNVTLTYSVKDHSSWTRNGAASPKPRPGLSYEQLCTEWNTFKYDEMLKSLWGIVTGRSGIHGIGLFTLTGYQKGDFIIEYAGDLIRTPLADIREARYEAAGLGTYLFKINEQEIVDATVQSNRARFTNHSCDPNMIARIIHVRGRDLVALQATRDIPKFAELTFDYKLPIEDKKVQCLCNAWNCVGVMN